MRQPVAAEHPSDAGIRIATPVCGLVRNDTVFDTFCTYFWRSLLPKLYVIARSRPKGGDVAIRSPTMRSIVSAHRAENS